MFESQPAAGPAPLSARGPRPARDRSLGRAELPVRAGPARAGQLPARRHRRLRAADRAAPRLLLDRRHGARPRPPARRVRRPAGRADGHLLRHARRAAVRARVPLARRPARPRLDRRPRRAGPAAAGHGAGAAARAARAVRRAAAAAASPTIRWPTSRRSARRLRSTARCAAPSSTAAAAAGARSTGRRTSSPTCCCRATRTRTCRRRCPGAIAAARRGDPSLLLRLRRIGDGTRTPPRDLSFGLNVTTGCLDPALPYPLDADPAQRAGARPGRRGRRPAGRPRRRSTPRTVLRTSYADDCLQWPADPRRPPYSGPAPRRPGAAARRPPGPAHAGRERAADGRAAAARGARDGARHRPRHGRHRPDGLRRARRCGASSAAAGSGAHARGRTNAVRPFPRPPRSLRDFRSAPGVGATAGARCSRSSTRCSTRASPPCRPCSPA